LIAQNHDLASITHKVVKEDGLLDFKNDSPEQIERKVRAYQGWPGPG